MQELNMLNETNSQRKTAEHRFEIPEWNAFTFYENAARNHSRFLRLI